MLRCALWRHPLHLGENEQNSEEHEQRKTAYYAAVRNDAVVQCTHAAAATLGTAVYPGVYAAFARRLPDDLGLGEVQLRPEWQLLCMAARQTSEEAEAEHCVRDC
eukprot:SAG31_NODE_1031_length_10234_cov_6.100049_6_plen_105_part_00